MSRAKILPVLAMTTVSVLRGFGPLGSETITPKSPTASDSITISISGDLPQPCYPTPTSSVTVSGNTITVDLSSIPPAGVICAQVITPFSVSVTLGKLSAGAYSITYRLFFSGNLADSAIQTFSVSGAPACTYAISPGGQTFTAAGGSGTFNITAGAGCPWTAASAVTWVNIAGVATGSGNGTVAYQATANAGSARSGGIAIAGLYFYVEEAGAFAGFASGGSMAQLASAGYWTTTITLVNTGSTPAQARLNFFDNNGSPLALPLSFPTSSGVASPQVLLLASTLDRTLNPGAELVIQSTGPSSQPTLVGWAQLLTSGTIGGFAVFSQATGNANQEAVVPLENRNASGYIVAFDNTNGSATGVALANISPQTVTSAITIRDDTGAVILSDSITLPALGHASFNLTDRYASVTAQRRGTLEFRTPGAGQISVLGLRFNASGAFSTIPALAE